jgi:hypothetical protein
LVDGKRDFMGGKGGNERTAAEGYELGAVGAAEEFSGFFLEWHRVIGSASDPMLIF